MLIDTLHDNMNQFVRIWQAYFMTVYVPDLMFLVHMVAEKLAFLESFAGVCHLTLTFDLGCIITCTNIHGCGNAT